MYVYSITLAIAIIKIICDELDLNKIVEFEPDAFMNFSLRTKHIICPILVGHAYHNLDHI